MEVGDAFERLKLIRSSNKSAVWKHFGFLEHGGSFVKCIHCETTLKYSNNTTNFRHHLRSKHRGIFDIMVALERNAIGNTGPSGIGTTIVTIASDVLPPGLTYSTEYISANDSENNADNEAVALIEGISSAGTLHRAQPAISYEKTCTDVVEFTGNEAPSFNEGISSAETLHQGSIVRPATSYEKTRTDEIEITGNEAPSFNEGRMNRKRKNKEGELSTVAKLMKDYLNYQKESDQHFLELERRWQEREERLRKEDREHSLYMLKLLLAKKQDK